MAMVSQMLVLDTDATRGRQAARVPLSFLSGISGYRASFARTGFTDRDIAGLSDHLVDNLVICGRAGTIMVRISEHLEAGADQVALTVLSQEASLAPSRRPGGSPRGFPADGRAGQDAGHGSR